MSSTRDQNKPEQAAGDFWPSRLLGCLLDENGNPTDSLAAFYRAMDAELKLALAVPGLEPLFAEVEARFNRHDWSACCTAARRFYQTAAEPQAGGAVPEPPPGWTKGVLVCWLLSAGQLHDHGQAEKVMDHLLEQGRFLRPGQAGPAKAGRSGAHIPDRIFALPGSPPQA